MTTVRRAWWWTLAVAILASAAVIAVPVMRIGVESVRVRAAIESAQLLVAFLAGLLVFGRFRRSNRESDLLIAAALFLLAGSSLVLEVLPDRSAEPDFLTLQVWGRLFTRIVAGGALAVASLGPTLRIPGIRGRPAFALWLSVTWTLAIIVAATWAARDLLPEPTIAPLVDGRLHSAVTSDVLLFAAHLAVVGVFAAASVGFLHQSEATPEPLLVALAVGTVLGALSWALFLVYPTMFTDVVQFADLLRLAFYVVLAVGAEREIHAYWSRLVRAATSEERRRMARDLHDGLAQELAFLSRHSRLLARGDAPPGTADMMISAADRALDEARRAISTLTATTTEPLAEAIASAAEDVADRVGTHVRVDVDPSVEVAPPVREAVLRIVREAVGNAGRHGHATLVTVALTADRCLQIVDDGLGFDTTAPTPAGRFGLTSMRERAEGVDARFAITSAPGRGTIVEVQL